MSDTAKIRQVLVPIVGRPNVGKSTLFNRLIEEKRAITGSTPGLTRDRITGTITSDNGTVTLVDTAGFQPDHPAPSPGFILNQIETMVEEGEVILFVVDATTNISQLDREIVKKLRPVQERVVLVVNKVDPGRDLEVTAADYYELGLQHVVPLSAAHNRNLSELKEKIFELAPEVFAPPEKTGMRIALTGRPNVGKSTLFNSILGYDRVMVSEEPGTTRDVVDVAFSVDDKRYHLMDTVGIRRKSRVEEEVEEAAVMQTLRSLEGCDVACLMLDWNDRVNKQDQRLAGLIVDRYRGCMILVNKTDEADEKNEKNWRNHIAERLHFLKYAPVLFTSGKERRGLANIFATADAIYEQMNRRFEANQLHNAFLDLKQRITWPSSSSQDVILKQIRQVDINPVTFALEADNPSHLTASDLRHLRKLLRDQLDLKLAPIKLNIVERLDEESEE